MTKNLLVMGIAGTAAVAAWMGCSSSSTSASGTGGSKTTVSATTAASSGGTGATSTASSGGTGGTTAASSSSGGTGGTTTASSSSGGTGGTTTASSSSGTTTASSSSSGSTTSSSSSSGSTDGGSSTIQCNPVTAAGCTGSQATCDINGPGDGVTCYAGPNPLAVCADCSNDTCGPGLTCFTVGSSTLCARYCCTNADCGAGSCQTTQQGAALFSFAPSLGLCVAPASDGGATDAGAGGNPFECTVPSSAPSNGSCVTVP